MTTSPQVSVGVSNWTVVFGPTINLREAPRADSTVVGALERGSVVVGTIVPEAGNWLVLADGRGFVMIKHDTHGQLLVPTPAQALPQKGSKGISFLQEQVRTADPTVRLEILKMLLRDAPVVQQLVGAPPYPVSVE